MKHGPSGFRGLEIYVRGSHVQEESHELLDLGNEDGGRHLLLAVQPDRVQEIRLVVVPTQAFP